MPPLESIGAVTIVLGVLAVLAILLGGLSLNTSFIPTPQDEALRLESSITKTATFNGTSFDQGSGFAPGGIGMAVAAVVNVSAIDSTTGDETYSAQLEESSDNATFTAAGPSVSLTATGAKSVPGFISKRYNRVKLTLAGTTPSITYEAWLNPNV